MLKILSAHSWQQALSILYSKFYFRILFQSYKIVPIEIKAEENLQSKSLKTVLQNNPEMHGVRFSMSPYKEQERMTNVPLYGAGVYFSKY